MKILKADIEILDPEKRLYQVKQPIIAITGSIATGKSSATAIIRKLGYKVICADELVKAIYQTSEAQVLIQKVCPEAMKDGIINFTELRQAFFDDEKLKKEIETFIYLKLPEQFLKEVPVSNEVIFYDVPLLYEKNLESYFDLIIVIASSSKNQLERLKKRDHNSTLETLKKIIEKQMPVEKKAQQADYVIDNNGTVADLEQKIKETLEQFLC